MKIEVKKYTVSILNDSYTLKSDEDESIIMAAASRVNTMVQELASKGVDLRKAAIFTALKLSLDSLTMEKKREAADHQIEKILTMIEQDLI